MAVNVTWSESVRRSPGQCMVGETKLVHICLMHQTWLNTHMSLCLAPQGGDAPCIDGGLRGVGLGHRGCWAFFVLHGYILGACSGQYMISIYDTMHYVGVVACNRIVCMILVYDASHCDRLINLSSFNCIRPDQFYK